MVRAQGYLLTLASAPDGDAIPLARAFTMESIPGPADLELAIDAADDAFRDSVHAAVRAARAATGIHDGRLRAVARGARELSGGSSAHEIALLAASALSGRSLARHFAIGHLDASGHLVGGDMAPLKARAASDVARGLGWPAPVPFLHPPRAAPFQAPPALRAREVSDVKESLALLSD